MPKLRYKKCLRKDSGCPLLDEKDDYINNLLDAIVDFKNQIKELEDDIKFKDKCIDELQDIELSLKEDVKVLNQDLEKQENETAGLEDAVCQLNEEITEILKENKSLLEQLSHKILLGEG